MKIKFFVKKKFRLLKFLQFLLAAVSVVAPPKKRHKVFDNEFRFSKIFQMAVMQILRKLFQVIFFFASRKLMKSFFDNKSAIQIPFRISTKRKNIYVLNSNSNIKNVKSHTAKKK